MIFPSTTTAPQINTDFDTVFQAMEDKYKECIDYRKKLEQLTGTAPNKRMFLWNAGYIIWALIYLRITDGYEDVKTWDEYKAIYDLEDLYDCFGCNNVNLKKIIETFDFEDLIANQ